VAADSGLMLQHVTIQTGDIRESPRSEVSAEAVALLRVGFLPSLMVPVGQRCGPAVDVPGFAGYQLRRWRVFGTGASRFTLSAGEVLAPILSVGIGWGDPGAARLWRDLAGKQWPGEPARPWVADRIEPGILALDDDAAGDVALWSADMARCLAWSVLPDSEAVG